MKMSLRRLLVVAAILAVPALAMAKWLPVHHVESFDSPLYIADGDTGKWYKQVLGFSMTSWQEDTTQAFSHAVGLADGGGLYEFRLITVTTPNTNDQVEGLWDVYRDGVLVCDDCVGRVYNISTSVGDYFKIYVGTPLGYAELWHWSGNITYRSDY